MKSSGIKFLHFLSKSKEFHKLDLHPLYQTQSFLLRSRGKLQYDYQDWYHYHREPVNLRLSLGISVTSIT